MKQNSKILPYIMLIIGSVIILTGCSIIEEYVDLPEIKLPKLGKGGDLPAGMRLGCYCAEGEIACFLEDQKVVFDGGDSASYRKVDEQTLEIYSPDETEQDRVQFTVSSLADNRYRLANFDGEETEILMVIEYKKSRNPQKDIVGKWESVSVEGEYCDFVEDGEVYEFTREGKLIEDYNYEDAQTYKIFEDMLILDKEEVVPFYYLGEYVIVEDMILKKLSE